MSFTVECHCTVFVSLNRVIAVFHTKIEYMSELRLDANPYMCVCVSDVHTNLCQSSTFISLAATMNSRRRNFATSPAPTSLSHHLHIRINNDYENGVMAIAFTVKHLYMLRSHWVRENYHSVTFFK